MATHTALSYNAAAAAAVVVVVVAAAAADAAVAVSIVRHLPYSSQACLHSLTSQHTINTDKDITTL